MHWTGVLITRPMNSLALQGGKMLGLLPGPQYFPDGRTLLIETSSAQPVLSLSLFLNFNYEWFLNIYYSI